MSKLLSGHEVEELVGEEMEQYKKDFLGSAGGMVKLNPGGWVLPKKYLKFADDYYSFKFRPDDVLIMTYPKCGTTWMQEIVWNMRNNPNLDNPQCNDLLFTRSPFLEFDCLKDDNIPGVDQKQMANDPQFKAMSQSFMERIPKPDMTKAMMLQLSDALPDKRTLKTHLPFTLMPQNLLETCKVIFVARNAMDAVLSYQHHCRLIKVHGFVSTQDVFVDYFVRNMVEYGSYAEMIKEAWQKRNHPNLHFVFYEDMKADIDSELKKISDFIGAGLTKEQLENIKKHTSFSAMKAKDPVGMNASSMVNGDVLAKDGGFVRQGKSGTWKDKLTDEQVKKMKDYVNEQFKGTDIHFKYE